LESDPSYKETGKIDKDVTSTIRVGAATNKYFKHNFVSAYQAQMNFIKIGTFTCRIQMGRI